MRHGGEQLAACAGCHENQRPVGLINKMDHVLPEANGDCVACHKDPGVTWANGVFIHAAPTKGSVSNCYGCHSSQVPGSQIPGTLISNMIHGIKLDPAIATSTLDHSQYCGQCHSSPGVSWVGGVFHSVIKSNSLTLKTCQQCHLSLVKGKGAIGSPAFNHDLSGGSGDCIFCHASNPADIGVSWKNGYFTHAGSTAPCMGCHTAPAGAVGQMAATATKAGSAFVHNGFVGTRDCYVCHTGTPGALGAWQTPRASFGVPHDPAPVGCKVCHTVSTGHVAIGGSECKSCHLAASSGVGWGIASGGVDHSGNVACTNCHLNSTTPQLVVKVPSPIAGSSRALGDVISVAEVAKIPARQFKHSLLGASPFPARDCISCHPLMTAGDSWMAPNPVFHSAGITIANCNSCHVGLVATISVAAGATTAGYNFAHNSASLGSSDCKVCHTSGTTSWTSASFPHSPLPANCNSCHTAPTGATGVIAASSTIAGSKFIHAGFMGTRDCDSCHAGVAGTATGWQSPLGVYGNLHNPHPTTCKDCHSVTVGHTAIGTSDCKGCHAVATAGGVWGPGADHSGNTSCTSCHLSGTSLVAVGSSTVTSTTTVITVGKVGKVTAKFRHDSYNSSVTDCKGCHKINWGVAGGWNLTMPTLNKTTHALVTMASCQSCHSYHNNTQICTSCHKHSTVVPGVAGW